MKFNSDAERERAAEILRRNGVPKDELGKSLELLESGGWIDHVHATCWSCNGYGFVFVPGCTGSKRETCVKCHGSGRRLRMVIREPNWKR